MEWDRAAGRDRAGVVDRIGDGTKHETPIVIVFDWDDTILPTTWLERLHAVPGRGQGQAMRLLTELCNIASETLAFAETLGRVIFITNSAPGWVDQSCQHFMPQLLQQMRRYEIYAKPMNLPITFKMGAFQRECKPFRNVVSVGDGDAERAASLRLQAAVDRKATFGGVGQPSQLIKSVKLIDFPTCQHLIAQHDMLQAKLAEVVSANSSLDLKARFLGTTGPRSPIMDVQGRDREASSCQLVHFTAQRPTAGLHPSASTGALPPLSRGGARADAEVPFGRDAGPRAASVGAAAVQEAFPIPGMIADADEAPEGRAGRPLRGGASPGPPRAPGPGDVGAWRAQGAPAAGEARGRLFPSAVPKQKPAAVLSSGMGQLPAPGGAAWREPPRPSLHASSRAC
ncbi:unnamed protein product [Prorocentrum cordatum]|uniref:Uncharacterized protein n=1 Tax=Prorocentrum cordatum TaxID=2364126 RepID=A0ABN9WHK2_9DINO|nr:unnamed protein product [Polarella glacialis]